MPVVTEHDKDWYVLTGSNTAQREWCKTLETEVKIVGDRVYFKPNKAVCRLLSSGSTIDFNAPIPGAVEIQRKVMFAHKRDPYPHQEEILYEAPSYPGYALFWEMGLGKTKTALDFSAFKFIDNKIDTVLVVTLKGVHTNWVTKEIPEHMAIPCEAFAWPLKKREEKIPLESKKLTILTINFDGFWRKKTLGYLMNLVKTRRVYLIVDESHSVKTPSAKRTKHLLDLAKHCPHRLILTGTPITRCPLDAWSQMAIVNPKIWGGKDYFLFEKRYAIKKPLPGVFYERKLKNGTTVKKQVETIVGYKHVDELKEIMAPFVSRLRKDDVLDLPPKLYNQQVFDMSPEQVALYNELVKNGAAELEEGRLSIDNQLVLQMRLHQISCGLYVTDEGETKRLKTNPRMEALRTVCEQVQGKGIIWSVFKPCIVDIKEYLTAEYGEGSVVVYTGDTKTKERTEHVKEFQDPTSKVMWFLGNPQAGGTGITLTQGRDSIYHSHSFRYEMRLQTEDRTHRIGQDHPCTYTDLLARGSVDDKHITSYLAKDEIAATITGDPIRTWLTPIRASS